MSVVTDVDRMWLHDLGLAEGIDSLVDPELSEKSNRITRDRDWNDCEECGCVPYALRHGPEGQRVCADCRDELKEWYTEHAPKFIPGAGGAVCSTRGCGAEPVRDSDQCARCDTMPPSRAFYP